MRSGQPGTIREAYSATGTAWQEGPARIYDRLAEILVERSPVSLAGRKVLDLGSGTGAASRAARAAAASPIALDGALGMLLADRDRRPPAVVGDLRALPLRDRCLDGVIAAFSLNHLDDPARGLRDAARVVGPGGPLLASAYATDDTHAVKEAVETAARELGWMPAGWVEEMRAAATPLLATVERATEAAAAAGLDALVAQEYVAFPDLDGLGLVRWRTGMAQLAPFVATLDTADRTRLVDRALDLLGSDAPVLVRSVIWITACVA